MRRVVLLSVVSALSLLTIPFLVVPSAEARPRPHPQVRPGDSTAAPGSGRGAPVQVGDLVLRPCDITARTLCGSIRRPWEPGNPSAGRIRVGFAFLPAKDDARPVKGTVAPHEGGPGYATTDSARGYRRMYGRLLDRRNLLLVDQRGTGLSEPVDCPMLQDLRIRYAVAAGRCGRLLGRRADDYTTALSADDTAAVIRRLGLDDVDLYGDSYGTFFQEVFAGRHPELVRSVVLDSAYPTYGETSWYPTQAPAMRHAFTITCERSPACADTGRAFLPTMRAVLDRVRDKPWAGTSYDADGRRVYVRVNPRNLAMVTFAATYGPAHYRELTGAMRSALRGDRAPLLRLVAEATGGGTDAGPVDAYSEGLDAAVACHDYPQLYDMTAPPGQVREQQYADALRDRTRNRPFTYAPFTVREYARSDWEYLSWCTRWPTAPDSNPAGTPTPVGGSYPDVPVLVMSGEMDSITTPAEGDLVTEQFPAATHVTLANSFHVNGSYDFEGCGQSLVRAFTRAPDAPLPDCADQVPPLRTVGAFPTRLVDVPAGTSAEPLDRQRRRTAPAAALAVADVMDRWWNNYSGHAVGLRGGTATLVGYRTPRFRLHDYQVIAGQRVSGSVVWDRRAKTVAVDLTVRGRGPDGRLRGTWDTRAVGATAVLHGRLEHRHVRISFPAP